jgi:ABC-type transporter Mla MlaB component
MTFRITPTTGDDGDALLIAGRLESEGLDELARAVAAAARPLTIDLGELRQADAAALAMLARLEGSGIRITGVSQYLRLRLDQCAADDTPR